MADGAQPTERKVNPAYRVWGNLTPEDRAERLQTVLERVLNDERTADIAKDLGLSRSALNMALLRYAEDDWRAAQVARALTRVERAKDERETLDVTQPGAALILARARDDEKAAQWELERLLSRLFGQKQELHVTTDGDWGERLRQAKARIGDVIDVVAQETGGAT